MPKTWRGGMIGAGFWSERQLRGWAGVENAEMIALCDRHPDRRQPRMEKFGISHGFSDSTEMLDEMDLDFVDICVRPHSHALLVKGAAERGLPVLCQKPFCTSLEEAREVVDFCKKSGVRLMINENYRWEPWYRKAKELLESGTLGEPFLVRHQFRNRFTIPQFRSGQAYFAEMPMLLGYEMGPHYFDAFRFLFGDPDSLFARMHRVSPHMVGDDVLAVVLGYPGLTCLIHTSWASVRVPGVDIPEQGYKGRVPHLLEIDGTEGTLILRSDSSMHLFGDGGYHQQWQFPSAAMLHNILATQQHFIDCLETGAEFETSGEYNLRTMALVYACYRSVEEGRVVNVSELSR